MKLPFMLRPIGLAALVAAVLVIAEWRPLAQSPGLVWLADDVASLDLGPWNCLRRPRINGFDFDQSGMPVVGWAQVEGCGGTNWQGWAERLAGGWDTHAFVPAPDIQMSGHEFGLGSNDRPYLYSIGFKDEVYRVYRSDLRAQAQGEPSLTDTGEIAGYNQQCVYTRFRLDRNGAMAVPQRVMTIGDCGGRGPIRLNGANVLNYVRADGHDFALGPDGTAHVAFIDSGNVYYTRPGLGQVLVATVNRFSDDIGIAAAADGTLHLVVRGLESTADYDRGKLGYYRSTDNGVSWMLVETLNVNPTWGLNLELDASGEPALAYWFYNELRYASRAGGTWTTMVAARPGWEGVDWLAQPRLRFDAAGVPHIAYYDWSANRIRIVSPVAAGSAPPVNLAVSGNAAPNPTVAGMPIDYTLRVRNGSVREATGVRLRVTLPAGAQVASSDPAPLSNSGGVLTYNTWRATGSLSNTIGPATTVTISLQLQGLPAGVHDLGLEATSAEADGDTADNVGTVRARVNDTTCALPSSGRQGWWPADGNASNYGSLNYPGTLVGNVSYGPGAVGQAFVFDGTTGYVSVPNGYDEQYWPLSGSLSVAAWARTTKNDADVQAIASMDDMANAPCCGSPQGSSAWYLYVQNGVFKGSLRNNQYGAPGVVVAGHTPVADGTFHHAALVVDTPALEARLYVDGKLEASAALTPGWTMSNGDYEAEPVVIGASQVLWGTGLRYFFSGAVDDVSIYKRVLTPGEIGNAAAGPSLEACGASPPVNADPVAAADELLTNEDEPVTADLLANDSDGDGGILTVTTAGPAGHGTVQLNPDGSVTYDPAPNFGGEDAFSYTVADGQGGTATGNVHVTVAPVNDPPTVVEPIADLTVTDPSFDVVVPLDAVFGDVDNSVQELSLSFTNSNPALVAATIDVVTRRLQLHVAPGINGLATVTVRATDPGGLAVTDEFTVTAIFNRPPTTNMADLVLFEGQPAPYIVIFDDPDHDAITASMSGLPPGVTAAMRAPGEDGLPQYHLAFGGAPAPGSAGAYPVTLTIDDGMNVVTRSYVITVRPPNQAPVARDDEALAYSSSQAVIPVLANDSDPEGDSLRIVEVTEPLLGHVTVRESDVVYSRTSNDGFATDTFTYTIEDAFGRTATATVTVRLLAPGVDLVSRSAPSRFVRAGETFDLDVTITNEGSAPAEAISGTFEAPDLTLIASSVPQQNGVLSLDPIAPGASLRLTLTLRAPNHDGSSDVRVMVQAADEDYHTLQDNTTTTAVDVQPEFCFVPQPGLRGFWSAEYGWEAQGSIVGYGPPPTLAPSRVGRAFLFTGDVGAAGQFASAWPLPQAFTVAAWANRDPAAAAVAPVVMARGASYGGSTDARYWLGFEDGYPVLTIYGVVGAVGQLRAATAVAPSTWVHLAATYDGAMARLYVNGVEAAAAAIEVNWQEATAGSIGSAEGIGPRGAAAAFTGLVDDVAIYDRPLGGDDVRRMINSSPACVPSTSPSMSVALTAAPNPTRLNGAVSATATVTNTSDGYLEGIVLTAELDELLSLPSAFPSESAPARWDLPVLLPGETFTMTGGLWAPDVDGHFPVSVTASSADGTSASAALLLTAVPDACVADTGAIDPDCDVNDRPVVESPGDQRSHVDDVVSLVIRATDADGDPVTFSATGLPAGLTIDAETGAITGTILAAGSGPHQVTIVATDGRLNGRTSFAWTIPHRLSLSAGRGATVQVNQESCDARLAARHCMFEFEHGADLAVFADVDPAVGTVESWWSGDALMPPQKVTRSLEAGLLVLKRFTVGIDHPAAFYSTDMIRSSVPVQAGTYLDVRAWLPEFLACSGAAQWSCEGRAAVGSTVVLEGADDPFAVFDHFSGACTGNACAITLDGDRAVTMHFRPRDVNVSLDPGSHAVMQLEDLTAGTSATCSTDTECLVPVPYGHQVRVSNATPGGWQHWQWISSAGALANDQPAVFTVYGDTWIALRLRSRVGVEVSGSGWTGAGPAPVHAYSATSGEVVALTCAAGEAVTCTGTAPSFEQIRMTVLVADDFAGWQGCLPGEAVTWCTQTSDQPVMNFVGRYAALPSPPTAVADELVIVSMAGTGQLDVLANDSDPDGGPLTLVEVAGAQFGTVSFSGSTVAYQPRAGDYAGHDTFTYTVSDADGLTATATVTVLTPADRLVDVHAAAGVPVASSTTGYPEISLAIRNLGSATATAVRLTLIGAATRVASIVPTRAGDSCRIEGTDWLCDLLPLTFQANTSFRVQLGGAAVGDPWRLELAAFAAEVDAAPANNRATLDINLTRAVADLVATLDGPDGPVLVNGDLTFTATIRNVGPDTSVQVPVTLQLPGVMAGAVPGGCTVVSSGLLSCTVPPMGAAHSTSFTTVRRSATPGTLSGTLSIVPDALAAQFMRDPQPANDSAIRQVVVVPDQPIRITVNETIGVRVDPVASGGDPIVRIEVSELVGVRSQLGTTGGQQIVRVEVTETVGVTDGINGQGAGGGGETPPGTNVAVALFPVLSTEPIVLTFTSVSSGGTTTAVPTLAPAAPVGFVAADPPVSYEISTTASFDGIVEVCVPYDRAAFKGSAGQRLLHYELGTWVDITTENDVQSATVCGETTSFSPFAVMETDIAAEPAGRITGFGGVHEAERWHRFALAFSDGWSRRSQSRFRYELDTDDEPGRGRGRESRRRWRTSTFEATSFDTIVFVDDPAFTPGPGRAPADAVVARGAGRWQGRGGYRFELRAEDRGEPGRGRDRLSLTIRDARGVVVVQVDGVLDAGNIQAQPTGRR